MLFFSLQLDISLIYTVPEYGLDSIAPGAQSNFSIVIKDSNFEYEIVPKYHEV